MVNKNESNINDLIFLVIPVSSSSARQRLHLRPHAGRRKRGGGGSADCLRVPKRTRPSCGENNVRRYTEKITCVRTFRYSLSDTFLAAPLVGTHCTTSRGTNASVFVLRRQRQTYTQTFTTHSCCVAAHWVSLQTGDTAEKQHTTH
jgi:hypothetical protein